MTSYELAVSGGDADQLRRELAAEAARRSVDLAVQRAGLHRRAKHLIVLDVDSTLLQGEVIDLLAERAGCADAVAAVTAAAMAGEVDFADAMHERLALLAGLDSAVLAEVADGLVLAPGARTLIRTLKRLGYVTRAGQWRVRPDHRRTGGGAGHRSFGGEHARGRRRPADGPPRRADGRPGRQGDRVEQFAAAAGVPLTQTVAVGDGANDLDMLAVAGLGIAFNAKPAVRRAADAALNVPYLDAILFLLGIPREEIEAADQPAD